MDAGQVKACEAAHQTHKAPFAEVEGVNPMVNTNDLSSAVSIRTIDAKQTWPLRHRVLRPHQTISDCMYPHDFSEHAIHVGAFIDGELVGVASAFRESQDGKLDTDSYRLRGMAVRPDLQSKGVGSQLLNTVQDEVAKRSGSGIWCNARTTAANFYSRHGFAKVGDEYELPGIGPHYLLVWTKP